MTLDDIHTAFVAGYETGKAERVQIELDALVQSALHARAMEALGMARRYAEPKGPAWTAMIDAQAGEAG